jgi:hypothetical protein
MHKKRITSDFRGIQGQCAASELTGVGCEGEGSNEETELA